MRQLVACPECKRQYDASRLEAEDRFHCLCGETLRVPRARAHDAAVVRCSSCGAPRQQGTTACSFCGADFTLHERDLHTICPLCMARVSDRARFCHYCASPLLPAAMAGEPTQRACPACPPDQLLSSRHLGEVGVTVLECPRCAGLWLGREELQMILERARAAAPAETAGAPGPTAARTTAASPPSSPLYRPCPVCSGLMHRRNYGRKSGIIVDSCQAHGVWFDARELDGLLRWIRLGGERTAGRQHEEELRAAERRARLARQLEPTPSPAPPRPLTGQWLLDLLAWLAGVILRA